jgi:transposase
MNKTTKRRELSVSERGEIIGAWKSGISERKIAAALNKPKSTVHNVISAYRKTNREKPPPRRGRPRAMTERGNRHLRRVLRENQCTTLQELHENFVVSTSTKVSMISIRRYLHEQGFFGRVGVRKPLINEVNRRRRLFWAKERKAWGKEWEKVIWSDESRFELYRGDGKKYVWRQPHEKYDVGCLIPTFKSGQKGVMVWGCFTKNGLGPLVRLDGKVTAAVYVDMLENHLLPYLDTLDNKENYVFQEDNAPIHRANKTDKWRRENNISSLSWPAQSPDLNPIEHLWDELERQVRAHKPLPKNCEELWQILKTEWLKIDERKYKNLVDSMPRRVAEVITNKGNATRY